MNGDRLRPPLAWPALGCLCTALALFFLCLMPIFMVDVMRTALERLHLSPPLALAAVVGIFLGGLINIPVYQMERETAQPIEMGAVFGLWGWTPRFQQMRQYTTIAVNVGGCVIPSALAAWQLWHLVRLGGWPLTALAVAAAVNIAACYALARPVRGVGIMMPGFVSPAVSIGIAWLFLGSSDYASLRAPVAFTAGVLGPLVGADLLRLKDITRVSVGMLSIGGAGTFDGIVLSGVVAALLA